MWGDDEIGVVRVRVLWLLYRYRSLVKYYDCFHKTKPSQVCSQYATMIATP